MMLELTSTPDFVAINGLPCRVWVGVTELGTPCVAFIHRVVAEPGLEAELDRDLIEVRGDRAPGIEEVLARAFASPELHESSSEEGSSGT